MNKYVPPYIYILLIMVFVFACTSFPPVTTPAELPTPTAMSILPTQTMEKPTEPIPTISQAMKPSDLPPAPEKWIDDADSSGTGADGGHPSGEAYQLNRLERPFLQDMTYVPDMDIRKFGLSEDENWYYVSIQLVGSNPNNALGIDYGAEIDTNADGFGDLIIWTHPPYMANQWDNATVQVFKDSNHDSAGQSATKSDPGKAGNGYDTLIFDGSSSDNADPDLAWVRLDGQQPGRVQIAFKKTLTGPAFMLGVVADGGLKDVSQYDYADHFTKAQAGSPIKGVKYFPLRSLYAVDNTCWEIYGMQGTGSEPKSCQSTLIPINTPTLQVINTPASACNPPPDCGGGPYNPQTCECQ